MMPPSEWPRSIKMGLALAACASVLLYYVVLCAGVAQLAHLLG